MVSQENWKKIYSFIKTGRTTWVIFSAIFSILIVFSGYYVSTGLVKQIDATNREDLLTKIETVALLVNANDVATLSGTEKDLTSPAYTRLKAMLYNLHNVNNGSRFFYFMRSSENVNNKLIFLVDSERPDSPSYSPPGQVYQDTSELEMSNYLNAIPFVEGPYTDSWGTWVSAYAPIWLEGKMIGIIGTDVSATKWKNQVDSFKSEAVTISILLGLLFLFTSLFIHREVCYGLEKKINTMCL